MDCTEVRRPIPLLIACIGAILTPAVAHAHLMVTGLGPIYDGISHFATSPEDFLPLIALAFLAGLRDPKHARALLYTLPIAWLAGGLWVMHRGAPCYNGQRLLGTGCAPSATGLGVQDLSGERLPQTPEYSANLGASYELKFADLPYSGFIHADYAWRSKVRFNPNPEAPYGSVSSFGLLNASLGLRGKQGHYVFTLYGKNLTNEFYPTFVDSGFGTIRQWIPLDYKRIYGATFAYNF